MGSRLSVAANRRAVYRGVVAACCTGVLHFEPGSAGERREFERYLQEPRWVQLGLDSELAQKLAAIVFARFRELAKSLPPDPRPKR